MRAAAEIEPVALPVDLYLLVRRNGVDKLHLEQLALVAEHALCLLARPHLLGERLVAGDDLAHALLDRREILRGERLVAEEIVVEAVLDHRPDGDLGAGPQGLHRLRQHVRSIMADQLQRPRVVAANEFDLCVALYLVGEIGERPVERHGDRALGERRRDRPGDVKASDAFGVFAPRTVRKGEGDRLGGGHFQLLAHSLPTNAGKRETS